MRHEGGTRLTARHEKREEYAVDVAIDPEYQEWYERELLPVIKEKERTWLKSGRRAAQQDGASLHRGRGAEER